MVPNHTNCKITNQYKTWTMKKRAIRYRQFGCTDSPIFTINLIYIHINTLHSPPSKLLPRRSISVVKLQPQGAAAYNIIYPIPADNDPRPTVQVFTFNSVHAHGLPISGSGQAIALQLRASSSLNGFTHEHAYDRRRNGSCSCTECPAQRIWSIVAIRCGSLFKNICNVCYHSSAVHRTSARVCGSSTIMLNQKEQKWDWYSIQT